MKLVSLNEERKARDPHATGWSVVDALRATLQRIEAGEINPSCVYIAMFLDEAATAGRISYTVAGLDRLEAIGLLTCHVQNLAQGGD